MLDYFQCSPFKGADTLNAIVKYICCSIFNEMSSVLYFYLYFRNDGSFVLMEGLAIIFQSEITERDQGLYTCQASFYHHTAQVKFHVEVMSDDKHLGE